MGWFTKTTALAFEPNRLEIVERYEGGGTARRISARSFAIPSNAICEATGAITDQCLIEECLDRMIPPPALLTREVVAIAIPSATCFFRSVSIASETFHSPQQWLHRNGLRILPCDPNLLVCDISASPGETESRLNILVVAVKRDVLLPYLGLAAMLGREISLVMPACIARRNAVLAQYAELSEDPVWLFHNLGAFFEASLWRRHTLIGFKRSVAAGLDKGSIVSWLKTPAGMEESAAGLSDELDEGWRDQIRGQCHILERDGASKSEFGLQARLSQGVCVSEQTGAFDAALGLLGVTTGGRLA